MVDLVVLVGGGVGLLDLRWVWGFGVVKMGLVGGMGIHCVTWCCYIIFALLTM